MTPPAPGFVDLFGGRTVFEDAKDRHGRVDHGGGFFRLMQFLADRKTVRVNTYSPWLDQWLTGIEQQFELLLLL